MASTEKTGYVERGRAGLLALLMAPSAAIAESKFLSLNRFFPVTEVTGLLVSITSVRDFCGSPCCAPSQQPQSSY